MLPSLVQEPAAEVVQSSVGVAETLWLALIQGLTEFLPVSSSGHLVLMGEALELEQPGLLLPVALHLGTLVAVLVVYRADVAKVLRDALTGSPREALLIGVASLPAGLVGFLVHDFFEERFANGTSAAWGLIGTAAILALSDSARRRKIALPGTSEPETMEAAAARRPLTVLDALAIGIGQAVAILPGVSRSGTTIAVGLVLGLGPARAARFSFLMSIPVILGAALLEGRGLFEVAAGGGGTDFALLGWGLALSALVGWAALRVLLAFLSRGAFLWFAGYCLVLGAGYLGFA